MTEPTHDDWTLGGAQTTRIPPIPAQQSTDPVEASARIEREMRDSASALPRAARREAVTAASSRSWRIAIFGVVLAVVVSVSVAVAALLFAQGAASRVADERVARVASEQQAQADRAKTAENIASLQDANRQLAERGQAPVAAPAAGDTDQAALVAATTARVLAALPKYPTAQDLAPVIASVVASQPIGPTTAQLSTAIADYARANPAPQGERGPTGDQGPKGDTGDAGRPPTAEEIQTAVDAELAANPEKYRGPAGKPPASWTYTDLLGSHTCTRAGGSDDAATYTCD